MAPRLGAQYARQQWLRDKQSDRLELVHAALQDAEALVGKLQRIAMNCEDLVTSPDWPIIGPTVQDLHQAAGKAQMFVSKELGKELMQVAANFDAAVSASADYDERDFDTSWRMFAASAERAFAGIRATVGRE